MAIFSLSLGTIGIVFRQKQGGNRSIRRRTYEVEEREGRLFGFEFKWGEKKVKPPKEWLETYPESAYEVITLKNFIEFVL